MNGVFNTASLSDVPLLKKVWSEWSSMNWLRTGILLAGLVFSFLSVHKETARVLWNWNDWNTDVARLVNGSIRPLTCTWRKI